MTQKDIELSHVEHSHFLRGWRFKVLVATVILAMIGYLIFTLWGGWNEVVAATIKVGYTGILATLVLSLVNYFLRFIRWQHYILILGHRIPMLPHLRIYLSGFSLTMTPGRAGEALKSVFLKDYHVPYRQSFGAFLSEKASDMLAVFLLSGIGFWWTTEGRYLFLGLVGLLLLCIYIIQSDLLLRSIERFFKKVLSQHLAETLEFVIETIVAFRRCYTWGAMFYGTILGVAAWGAQGVAFYFLLKWMGTDVGISVAIYIYSFGLLVGGLTFLPGGLGGAEITMIQLLIINGVSSAEAVAATLVIRILTLWFSVILGLALLPYKKLFLLR